MHLREKLLGTFIQKTFSRLMHFDLGDLAFLPDAASARPDVLYIHIPFCESLCPFCSFHRVLLKNTDDARNYFETLRQEIRLIAEKGHLPSIIYVGGGTPTVMPDELEKTLELVQSLFPVSQVSVETNPNHLNDEVFTHLGAAGVNRLSIGIQSFDDDLLKKMGRYDSYGSGQENIERLLHAQGQFDTINADMIFNLPGQTEDALHEDLRILLDEVAIDQVSYYPLMTSSHTAHEMKRSMGISEPTNEEAYYDLIRSRLDSEYSLSSVWCFSRKQGMVDEYIISDSSYIGAGSGSFSYLDGVMYSNSFSIKRYQQFIRDKGSALTAMRSLSRDEQAQYDLVMTLFGGSLNTAEMERKYDGHFSKLLWKELDFLYAIGLIRHDTDTIALTRRGQYDWVVLMREFFIGVDNFRDEMRRHVGAELATLGSKPAALTDLQQSQTSIS